MHYRRSKKSSVLGTGQTPVYQDLSARKSHNVPLWLLVHALIGLLKKRHPKFANHVSVKFKTHFR